MHSLLVSVIDQAGVKVVSQSPRLKLQDHWGLTGYVDSDSNAYNKNKNKGKAIAQHFCNMTRQTVDLDRDISDAILQGIHYMKNVAKLPFSNATFEETKAQPQPSATVAPNDKTGAKAKR